MWNLYHTISLNQLHAYSIGINLHFLELSLTKSIQSRIVLKKVVKTDIQSVGYGLPFIIIEPNRTLRAGTAVAALSAFEF